MNSHMLRGTLAALALVGASAAVEAQNSRTPVRSTGLILNARLGGTNYSPDEGDGSTGGSFGLGLGWAFTPRFSVLLAGDGSAFEDEELNSDVALLHGDLLARWSFHSPTSIYVPYIEGGFTSRAWQTDEDVTIGTQSGKLEYSGSAFTVGGGVNFFFTQAVAFDLGLRFSIGSFDTIEFRGTKITDEALEEDANTTRLTVGLTWFPMRGRQ